MFLEPERTATRCHPEPADLRYEGWAWDARPRTPRAPCSGCGCNGGASGGCDCLSLFDCACEDNRSSSMDPGLLAPWAGAPGPRAALEGLAKEAPADHWTPGVGPHGSGGAIVPPHDDVDVYASWGDANDWDFWVDWLEEQIVFELAGPEIDLGPHDVPRHPDGPRIVQHKLDCDDLQRQQGADLMEVPAWDDLNDHLRGCLEDQGVREHSWPGADCCTPEAPPSTGLFTEQSCNLPNPISTVDVRAVGDDFPFLYEPIPSTIEDVENFIAVYTLVLYSMALLRENLDVVEWALCLARWYSGDLGVLDFEDCVLSLVSGDTSLHFTFVDRFQEYDDNGELVDDGATAGAFTRALPASDGSLGVIIAADHPWWRRPAATLGEHLGGSSVGALSIPADALCAVVSAAAQILHELVHICGDAGGTLHPEDQDPAWSPDGPYPRPCWDEAAMIDSVFAWAMTQRFSCVANSACCAHMADDDFFMTSEPHDLWLGTGTPPC